MAQSILEIHGESWSDLDAKPWFDSYAKARGAEIPSSFSEFYAKHNGIKIKDEDFEFVIDLKDGFGQREDLRFQGLYSTEDIFLNFHDREGVSFPEGTIPFVCIEQGEICISVRDDSFGQVFFCELDPMPEQMPESSSETALKKFNPSQRELPGMLLKLADSFDRFLQMIKVEEW